MILACPSRKKGKILYLLIFKLISASSCWFFLEKNPEIENSHFLRNLQISVYNEYSGNHLI